MREIKNFAGTYDFKMREDKSHELQRLQKQAGLGIEAERAMWKMAGLQDGMSVLDLGCGPGVVACSLATEIPNGHVVGVDLSDELLSQAVANQRNLGVQNLSFMPGNIYDLSFDEGTFDFVYARFVFQHLKDPQAALKNIFRVLKPGGRVCLMDVDDHFFVLSPEPKLFRKFHEAAILLQRDDGGNREMGREFYRLLSECGFQKPQTHVHVIRSQDCGLKPFLDVSVRFKANKIKNSKYISNEECASVMSELSALEQQTHAWGAMGVFVGVGIKKG